MIQSAHLNTTAIWSFNRRLTHRLAAWSAISIVGGAAMIAGGKPFWRALGAQNVTWGAIDAAIACGGQLGAERKQASATPTADAAHARQLRRVLWLNAGLDVLYVCGGVWLLRARPALHARPALRAHRPERLGHGLGVLVQGAFLLIFDVVHALRVPHIDQV